MSAGFLNSKVLWTDETPHVMDIPTLKPLINGTPFNLYEDEGVLLVETASFVSLLVNRDIVKKVGLPIKEFFIWADDVEYTLRISRSGLLGLYVKDSIVIHKTKNNYSASNIYDWRFYYHVRNHLWISKLHYKRRYVLSLLKNILLTLTFPLRIGYLNIKASIDSFIRSPKVEYCKKVRDLI